MTVTKLLVAHSRILPNWKISKILVSFFILSTLSVNQGTKESLERSPARPRSNPILLHFKLIIKRRLPNLRKSSKTAFTANETRINLLWDCQEMHLLSMIVLGEVIFCQGRTSRSFPLWKTYDGGQGKPVGRRRMLEDLNFRFEDPENDDSQPRL